jgi:hypothetical protein
MARAHHKTKRHSAEAAVPVSYRLQFYSVVVAFSAVAFQAVLFVMNSGIRTLGTANFRVALPYFFITIGFPLVVFLIAFASSRRYAVPINRWFIAVLKALIAVITFSVLQNIWQWISISLYNPSKHLSQMPPAWFTSNAPLYVSMFLVIAGMLFVIYRQKQGKW